MFPAKTRFCEQFRDPIYAPDENELVDILTTKILNKITKQFDSDPYLTVLSLNKDYKHDMASGVPPLNWDGFFFDQQKVS